MPEPQPTPEEKLFAVIQGAKQPPIRRRPAAHSIGALGAKLASAVGPIDLPRVNQALTIVVVFLGLWCLISPWLMWPRLDRVLARARTPSAPFAVKPLEGLRSVEEYLQAVITQDPFRIGQAARPVRPPEPDEPGQPDPKALLAQLRLVGIAWAEEPQVMIEYEKQTYFLKVGDVIGRFTIKEIQPDRAVLRLGTQDLELF